MDKGKNNIINKKLLTFLVGAGLQISSAEARPIDMNNHSTPSVHSIKTITKIMNPLSNGCCGSGTTCNGSC